MRKLGLAAIGVMLAAFMAAAVSPARVSAGTPNTPHCQGYTATIWGDNDGTINGTSKRDVIVGSNGDDVIKGNGGDDVICGGGGDDIINGNSGNDLIEGGVGSDYVAGDSGDDTLRGFINPGINFDVTDEGISPGADDTVLGGSGKDLLIDFWGWNHLDGGSGDDWVFGQGDLFGNANNDIVSSNFDYFWWLVYESGDDDARSSGVCNLGDGCGNPGSNLDGGSGNDELVGTWADDTLKGSSGNDELWGDGGDDEYNGGSGRDLCEESGISCEVVDNVP
jgi:Ca2+-binding RTX toxin-like protein